MTEYTVWHRLSDFLYDDIVQDREYPNVKPMLAHYTSLNNLENILKSKEIWLSNPLFMNDLEEVRFGLHNGFEVLRSADSLLEALGSDLRRDIFTRTLEQLFVEFTHDKVFDLYIMCFSEHDLQDEDGTLSMWRGYASNGNGAAIIFDTNRLPDVPDENEFILGSVQYATSNERIKWVNDKANALASLLGEYDIEDENLPQLAHMLFERLKIFSVFTKHIGFREEKEWRLVYWRDRDLGGKYEAMFGYFNGPRGIEPKLKLKPELMDLGGPKVDFYDIIGRVILGPMASSPLAKMSTARMMKVIGCDVLVERIVSSSIPYREQ